MNPVVNIQFSGIRKRYRRRIILDDVDISLHAEQCLLLCGANGAGKTTLLKIMAGLLRPDHGTMNIGLGEMKWRRCKNVLQEKVMYLHQHPYMFDASVRKNIAYGLPRNTSPANRRKHVDEALQWAGLEDLASADATSLSGGEAQRVALARAWLRAPAVLLLDEPTANMDQESRLRTHTLLRQLKDAGMAIVITSHDILQFQPFAEKLLKLESGRLTHIDADKPDNVSAFPLQQAHHKQA
jgi:tungstate transport system ATP-binding protein